MLLQLLAPEVRLVLQAAAHLVQRLHLAAHLLLVQLQPAAVPLTREKPREREGGRKLHQLPQHLALALGRVRAAVQAVVPRLVRVLVRARTARTQAAVGPPLRGRAH